MSIHFTFTLLRYWNISVNRRKYKIKNNSFHELNHSKIWQQIITKPTLAIKATKFSFVSNASQFIRPLNHGYFVRTMGWKKLSCLLNQKWKWSLLINHVWFKKCFIPYSHATKTRYWVLNAATQGKQQPCVQWYQIKARPCWALRTQLNTNHK